MKILSAHWHDLDVTEKVKQFMMGDMISVPIGNGLFGNDPAPEQKKNLTVVYEVDGKVEVSVTGEGDVLNIPEKKSKLDRLGIFYSDNGVAEKQNMVQASLNRIKVAAKDKCDVVVSSWRPIANCPFRTYISPMQNQGHLNQVTQIVQCLLNAEKIGNYKYVSFLEHDVLYPEGYFDYSDFEEGAVLTNMNYIGLSKEGWQPSLTQQDSPLHQMTMHFKEAKEHFLRLWRKAIVINHNILEPKELKSLTRKTEHPSAHVFLGEGLHFTNHYNIYSKEDIREEEKYWGNKENYSYIFPLPIEQNPQEQSLPPENNIVELSREKMLNRQAPKLPEDKSIDI